VIAFDLFACEGAASVGYQRAGFDVIAVDLDANRLAYNPADHLHLGDALDAITSVGVAGDFFHASPPCQGYSRGNAGKVTAWPKLIAPVRERLRETGRPYVIENVKGARPHMIDPVLLCGCMFDLQTPDTDGVMLHLTRPRLFEANFPLAPPRPCDHIGFDNIGGVYGGGRKAKRRPGETLAEVAPRDRYAAKHVRKGGYTPRSKEVAAALLGVTHPMTWQGLKECIPPAYAEWVGRAAMAALHA
jgi:DNA (cytosine-5)-methyltransferase 1